MAKSTYQENQFYDEQWTKDVNVLFIDVLVFQKQLGNFMFGKRNQSAIAVAIDSILAQYGKLLTHLQCRDHVLKLFKRYTTFKWMLSLKDVVYDADENYVRALARTWEFMFQVTEYNILF